MSIRGRNFKGLGKPQFAASIVAIALAVWGTVLLRAAHTVPPAAPAVSITAPRPLTAVQGASEPDNTPDCARVPCLALTFDDGPTAGITPQVLDILARHHVHATFFLIGIHVLGNEALVRRMYQEGHEIGNHSWTHPDLTTLPANQVEDQVTLAQGAITDAGVPAPRLFRPPYGAVNPMVRSHVPLTIAMWNADPEDWRQRNPKQIITNVEAAAGPGKIVDLHDLHQPTADALDQLLNDLQLNYQLVTVSQLLQLVPGQPGLFYGR